ncbi:hypothetical protein TWF506_005946 [Arthrobotrys conoides]|uniref:Uncharacterized protein n=1 Tax=Arthrobotrys conoides TaxID=74498 RepID=A0AAN8NKM7_9PEZI
MEAISHSPFLSLPNEIHIEVFKRCQSLGEAVALAATCQQLQSIWKNHQKAVISHICSNCIVAFDDALRAVRAIDMAERQYQVLALQCSGVNVVDAEKPPKRIPIQQLGAFSNPPSPDEITQVLDFKYFIEVALFLAHEEKNIHIFCQQSSSEIRLPVPCERGINPSNAGVSAAKETDFKIYASMYRFFLVSAVLSSVYWEPLFADHPTAAVLRRKLSGPLVTSVHYQPQRSFGEEELSYLRQWACYNKRRASNAQLDEIFGELGDYLVKRGGEEAVWDGTVVSNTQRPSGDRDTQAAGAVQTIMMILGCHELFWCVAQQQLSCAARAVERAPAWLDDIRYKRFPVTFLGIHGALDAWIPKHTADISRHPCIQLLTRPVGLGADGRPLAQVRLLGMFHDLLIYDLRDGSAGSNLPYELGFFEYLLKRKFGLKVRFEWGFSRTAYSRYLAAGTAFRGVEQFRRDVPDILSSCAL